MPLDRTKINFREAVELYWERFGPPPVTAFPDSETARGAMLDAVDAGRPIDLDEWLDPGDIN